MAVAPSAPGEPLGESVAVQPGGTDGEDAGAVALERTLAQRAAERPAGSYTVELLENPALIGEKVMEEAEEVARAAREESDERVDEEAADVLYHLLVLLRSRGHDLTGPQEVLRGRRR